MNQELKQILDEFCEEVDGLGAFMADISSEVVTDYNLGVTDSYKLGGGNGNSVSVETNNTTSRVYEDGSISLQPATPYAPVMGGD